MGSRRHKGAPRITAASQLMPRISHRSDSCPSNGFNWPKSTTSAQPPTPAKPTSQVVRLRRTVELLVVDPALSARRPPIRAASRDVDRDRPGSRARALPLCLDGPSRFQSPHARAPIRASRAQTPAVAQTSRNRLCGSWISSLASGSLYLR